MKSKFEFINLLKSRYNLSKFADDVAVLPKDDKTDLVISTDIFVEDIDFRLESSTPEQIGGKALSVSISELLRKPTFSLVSIGVPQEIWKSDFVDKFYSGYMFFADRYGVELIGGDISKTQKTITIHSTVLGEIQKGKAMV